MTASSVPAVLALLEGESNPAADDALLAALPLCAIGVQRNILDVLARRGSAHAGIALIRLFAGSSPDFQALIARYVEPLHSPLRSMMGSSELSDRLAAIELIGLANDAKSAYLLAEGLRHRCGRTREAAAHALERMVESSLAREPVGAAPVAEVESLAGALGEALAGWEIHLQPCLLHASLHMIDWTEPYIRQKLAQPQSRLANALATAIATTSDPRLAGAVLRFLGIPELRAAAGQCIARSRKREFIESLLAESWIVADPAVEHGCRSIRKDHWEDEWVAAAGSLSGEPLAAAVKFLTATGNPASAKFELFRRLMTQAGNSATSAILWRLIDDPTDASTQMLITLAAREGDECSRIARRECIRRGAGQYRQEGRQAEHASESPAAAGPDPGSRAPHTPAGQTTPGVPGPDHSALERLEALRSIQPGTRTTQDVEKIYRACNDPDPVVRSHAIAMLPDLSGPTATRLLRQALHDPDARVQANAIEALDAIGIAERTRWIAPMMSSPDNRVRGNAVKSCLRAEMHQAAEALLGMIENPSGGVRITALWIIETLRLRSLLPRVYRMTEADVDPRVRERAGGVYRRLADGDGPATTGRPSEVAAGKE